MAEEVGGGADAHTAALLNFAFSRFFPTHFVAAPPAGASRILHHIRQAARLKDLPLRWLSCACRVDSRRRTRRDASALLRRRCVPLAARSSTLFYSPRLRVSTALPARQPPAHMLLLLAIVAQASQQQQQPSSGRSAAAEPPRGSAAKSCAAAVSAQRVSGVLCGRVCAARHVCSAACGDWCKDRLNDALEMRLFEPPHRLRQA